MADAFIGEIRAFPYNFAPEGWLLCDGHLKSIASFELLFAVISTYYGGDGITTFAVPDLSARAALCAGIPSKSMSEAGMPKTFVGESLGAQTQSLSVGQLPSHTHQPNGAIDLNPSNNVGYPQGNYLSRVQFPRGANPAISFGAWSKDEADVTMAWESIKPIGGSQPHANMQPSLTFRFCIAYEGTYPVRS